MAKINLDAQQWAQRQAIPGWWKTHLDNKKEIHKGMDDIYSRIMSDECERIQSMHLYAELVHNFNQMTDEEKKAALATGGAK